MTDNGNADGHFCHNRVFSQEMSVHKKGYLTSTLATVFHIQNRIFYTAINMLNTRPVFDYPNCCLTKGEIGCVLSHHVVYKKMIDENINLALILEDDAILCDNIINEIDNIDNSKTDCVYLLNKVHAYVENKKLNSRNYDFFRVNNASCTCGYVINNKAAKKLLSNNYPVIFEADMWSIFDIWFGLKIYCAFPHVIETNDEDKRSSDIEPERKLMVHSRFSYRRKVIKKLKFYQIKRMIHHLIINRFIRRSWIINRITM